MKLTPLKLNLIAMIILIFGCILGAVALGVTLPIYLKLKEAERPEIYYPRDMPVQWDRIPGTNYVIARTFENKRDTLRIIKSVEISYTYQILTNEQKKSLKDSIDTMLR